MAESAAERLEALAALAVEAERDIRSASSRERLQQLRTDILGRKAGRLTSVLKDLPGLAPDVRREVGGRANTIKTQLEALLDEADAALAASERRETGADLTMPA